MIDSACDAKGILEGILSETGDMKDGLGDKFRLVISMAMQSCPEGGNGAGEWLTPSVSGGLATWRLRRAQALMMQAVGAQLSVALVARECGLSYTHFSRAFRKSVGVSPTRWLCKYRIERAKWLLMNTDHTLLEVALACGFSEQCYFTRMFTRLVGMGPAVWRRSFSADSELWSGTGGLERFAR